MENKVIIAGFGGQGVLSLGQLIAYASIEEQKEVTWLPSYGPEMRGGTSNCSIVISDKIIASPIVDRADCVIVMNRPSLEKFSPKVKDGGILIINSSLIPDSYERSDICVIKIKANDFAEETGSIKNANLVMLGAFVGKSGVFSVETISKVIDEKFSGKPKLIPGIKEAFKIGYEIGQKY
ncbi:MAG: Pyruvate synthase subunit PorC [Firmicutes bacterium ADurb.Bin080]|jgi:2-oxoglutarate ferredoxin oxidoreductase subunit gamma|nr:2-oxoacid:ferredoxin oxidoreductase subunit gamma [Clostridiales bacterium]OQC14992.1 MAG: Pyruvate synthase subunit PorC [Firmicutes bacterium ADurb.Bin080]